MAKKKAQAPDPTPAPAPPPSPDQVNFIRINSKILDDQALADHVGLAPEMVRAVREDLARADSRRVTTLMDRPAGGLSGARVPGVVAMSGAAADAADDWRAMGSGAATVTQTDINAALARKDAAAADRLTRMRDQQVRDSDSLLRARNSGRWHFIDGDR